MSTQIRSRVSSVGGVTAFWFLCPSKGAEAEGPPKILRIATNDREACSPMQAAYWLGYQSLTVWRRGKKD
jgi:hypothetical protein